jgi:hypothetical protein
MNNTGLHGKFERINENFLSETFDVFALLETIQKKYGKTDNDTIINEARDAKVAQVLGYNNINTDKHGWDAKADTEEFLEVKQASISSHSIGATFNDTTIEKTEEISKGNVTIALAVWSSLKDLLFVVYGKNAAIGEHLKQKIIQSKANNAIRPGTQSITMKDLIVKFGFKVRPVSMNKEEISETLFGKMKTLNKIIDKIPFDDEA